MEETDGHFSMDRVCSKPENGSRRIGIFLAMGTFETVSSLRDGVKLLAEHGFAVDIYVAGNPAYPKPQVEDKMISVVSENPAVFSHARVALPKWTFGRGFRLYSWFVLKVYGSLWRDLVFKSRLRSRHSEARYSCLIGIDQEAIADVADYAKYLGVPFAYWSLELRFAGQCRTEKEKNLKMKDTQFTRQAAFSIIQDEWRKDALINENGLDATRVMVVPNAPMGNARSDRTDFLRKRWNIAPGKKIVLCAGTLASWAMSKEIVEAANTWTEEWVLVMHSRRKPEMHGATYENEIGRLADPKRVIVSFDQFSADEYHKLLCSADVGLAFYNDASSYMLSGIDMNMKIMGLSSGKIADYLQHGIPIVVNESLGPRNLVEEYRCGVCVPQASDIAEALSIIFEDYSTYSKNACKCFDERLELKSFFAPVIDRLAELATCKS